MKVSPSKPALSRVGRSVVSLVTILVVLDYADRSALGAVAPALRDDLGLNLTQLGLLGAVFGLVGGVSTLVAGALVDRVPRLRMLALSSLTWSAVMLATGAAQNLLWLLLARSALSVVLATVGPAYPSLIGDAVPAGRRATAFGVVAGGQLLGSAVGLAVGAAAVVLLSWRWAFWVLAVPALLLAPRLWRAREPARTGEPDPVALLAVARRLWHTPTAWQVMVAVSVGSYYLAGASAFSTLFAVARYDVSTATADLALLVLAVGAVLGIVLGSRTSDRLEEQGRGRGRLVLAAVGYLLTAVLWLPALLTHSLLTALPFLVLGSAALASTLPALDAVRTDVIPPAVRGRTEAVRTLFRALAEGAAPLVFGVVAQHNGGDDRGLQLAFLLTLPGLVATAGLLLLVRRRYEADRAPVRAREAELAGREPAVAGPG